MDVLTNEGRYWYQGVRFSGRHQTAPLTLTASYTLSKAEDRLNHWFAPEDSSDPELDRGRTGADTPHNFVASATWKLPGSGILFDGWRLSAVAHRRAARPYSLRYTGDPTGTGRSTSAARAAARLSQAGGAQHRAGDFISYLDMTLSRSFQIGEGPAGVPRRHLQRLQRMERDRRRLRRHPAARPTSGSTRAESAVFPGRQFQFAITYRF